MWHDLKRVMGLWRSRAGWLWLGLAIGVLSVLADMALLALAGRAVAMGVASGTLLVGGALALGWMRPLVVLRPIARYLERLVTHEATFRALADTRVWFFRRLASALPSGLGLRRSGDLLGRLVGDVEALDGLYLRVIAPGIGGLAAVIAILLVLGEVDPGLAALVVLPLALALALPVLLAQGAARRSSQIAERQGALRATVADPLIGLEDTLAANAEPRAMAAMEKAADKLAKAQRRLTRRIALSGAAGSLLTQAAMLLALGWAMAAGQGGIALAVLALFLVLAASETLALLPRAGASLAGAGAAAGRLFEAADSPPPVAEPAVPATAEPKGHAIAIRDLRFAWGEDRAPVFDGLDLDLPEGGRIALLGPSGAGKSSLAAILLKFAAPQGGNITLGGVPLAEMTADAVRARITCLTQDARLFDDSIAANLRIARPEADDAALWRALEAAGIATMVRELPEGLETRCGEGGGRFSGGQGRRLALARSLLSPAPVLILDEPGAGLDYETERAFLETLDTATAGRSVILIAHRLLGVEHPTRILRLIGGRAMAAMG
ncbi:thiol reductant ABC exporter subunit CydC [Acetobacteraceae bacterium H6797]|nr:thiol reductant ABC exporter subunit CydC [Acetobacteraceae bacterium H6797]